MDMDKVRAGETTKVDIDSEDEVEIKINGSSDDSLSKQIKPVKKSLQNGKEKVLVNSDNSSNKQIEYMKSVQVRLQRIKYYDCKDCYSVFFTPHKLTMHSVKHVRRKNNPKQEVVNDRFVKRFSCSKCDAKFVLLSTLEAHSEVHLPLPFRCPCGVSYYLKKDLAAHRNLVHSEEIDQESAHLTFRQKREIRNAIWLPKTTYSGPKRKEPKSFKMKRKKM